jgi:hypothetical protein
MEVKINDECSETQASETVPPFETEAISPEHLCTLDLMKCARIENHGASPESCIQNVEL